MKNYEMNMDEKMRNVRFSCGGDVRLSNNEALNAIVKHLGSK